MISPNYRNISILLIIAATLILLTAIIIQPADAIRIEQGDASNPNAIIYLGETADISLALTWPDFKIAYCNSGYAGCNPPDQIITVAGFQHSYYIDPAVFHVGQYYRWSGEWNRGENQLAFYVKDGKRPVINETPTLTPTSTPEPGIDEKGNGPFHYLITRGDSPLLEMHFAKDSAVCSGDGSYDGYFWIFGTSSAKLNKKLLKANESDYSYPMPELDTTSLQTGKYTGYLQFTGKNGLQDVFVSKDDKFLDSPYDDKVVPNVPIDTTLMTETASSIKSKFETIVNSAKYSDDILIPITMDVMEPDIVITNIVQDDANLWITGRTTWCSGTEITFYLDPDNYALEQDKRMHTWKTKVGGDIMDYRTFEITIPYDYKELYVGKHTLKMSVDKNGYITDMYHDFGVTGEWVVPPTPEFQKYLTNMNGTRITMSTTIITTGATPVPTFNSSTITNITNITPSETHGVPNATKSNLTVRIGNATPTKTPKDQNITVPLNIWCGILALVVAWVVVRR